jgi:hypothetical protein
MSISRGDALTRLLPVVISGGRPGLAQRPVTKLLGALHGVTADPVWVVRDDDAGAYERDGHEILAYSRDWAEEYAQANWIGYRAFEPGGFLGAFPGREWACRVAAERGYDAVLQLDDNIDYLCCFLWYGASGRMTTRHGGMALFADLLLAVTQATNGAMVGAFLTAVAPTGVKRVARPGFPYSLFVEQLGSGREPWLGPFEDDITHAYQYAYSDSPQTALVMPSLLYHKERLAKTGMRSHYSPERAVALQRMFPESARVNIRSARSNGQGEPRVFHHMQPGAVRTRAPMVITDPEQFGEVRDYLMTLARECYQAVRETTEQKFGAGRS